MQSVSEDLIKIRGYYTYCLFPKSPIVLGEGDNTYGITKFEVLEVLEGNPVENKDYMVTITGEFFEPLKLGTVYTILAKKVVHPTYGVQYNLLYINEQIDLHKLKFYLLGNMLLPILHKSPEVHYQLTEVSNRQDI